MTHSEPGLLLLAVVYNNSEEVAEFCSQVQADLTGSVEVAVCDNSPTGSTFEHDNSITVSRPDNPGYWGGAMAALQAYRESHEDIPEWVAITNTDLAFQTCDVARVLAKHDPSKPIVLAPRITEGVEAVEKNPHVLEPRPRWRHRANHFATVTPSVAIGYLALSQLKFTIQTRLGNTSSRRLAATGTTMYSPYGAIIFFSRSFINQHPLPEFVPLLAEEWKIAEIARSLGAPVVFEPEIHVIHDAHQTTGPKISRKRAEMLTIAFNYITKNTTS